MKTKDWIAFTFIALIALAVFVTADSPWVPLLAIVFLVSFVFIAYRMSKHSELSEYDRRQEDRRKGR